MRAGNASDVADDSGQCWHCGGGGGEQRRRERGGRQCLAGRLRRGLRLAGSAERGHRHPPRLPRAAGADGAYALYLPNADGQWIYSAIGVWDRFNCATIWDGASTDGPVCPDDASIGASKGQTTVYPDGAVITVPNLGDGSSVRGPVLTGNPIIDTITTTASASDTSLWVTPRCQPVDSTTCVFLP
jgi:hypothetical protein